MASANVNNALLAERHETAARWERIRAAYFTRVGKPDNATRCKLRIQYHRNQAKQALSKA